MGGSLAYDALREIQPTGGLIQMRKPLLLLVAVAVATGSFGGLVQSASATEPIMCTLAKKGIIDPDSGPWCGPHNPPRPA
jgi:hypothetical protein